VLPLENLSPDADNAFFADGIQEEIIAAVSRLPGLKVISRNSTMSFKG
jgi:TolB-like protein